MPNPNRKPEVNHKNEDKLDNRAENLEWATKAENMNYGTRNERSAAMKKTFDRIRSKPVILISLDGKEMKEFASINEASRETGADASQIRI